MSRFRPLVLLAAVLALAGCSIGGNDELKTQTTTTTSTTATNTGEATTGPDQATDLSIPDLVDEVQPSIVSIVVSGGEGSGVIIAGDTIVTNDHVAGDFKTVQVVLADGKRLEGTVGATDPLTDLAIVTVDRTDLPAATLATGLPRVGEPVVAMGNPLGFESSVTAGIVSGLHREIPSAGRTPALIDLIQTDAAISPGNSGGALVNLRGEVVGIAVAYIPPAASAVSIGFAIPAPTVAAAVEELRTTGKVTHSFLGVGPADLTPQVASRFGIDLESGVLVQSVTPRSGAARAGLEPGDVIVQLDGTEIRIVEDLLSELRKKDPGTTIDLTIVRDGERMQVEATLGDRNQTS